MPEPTTFSIAAVQANPVFLDLDATIDKACRLIAEVGNNGASLAVFPEAFVPGYPLWVWRIPSGRSHELRELYAELHANSIAVPSGAVDRLRDAARDSGVTQRRGKRLHALQHAALRRARRQCVGKAPQADSDVWRAAGVGKGRRQ